MKPRHFVLAATLTLCIVAAAPVRPATTSRTTIDTVWFFVVIETHVQLKNVEVDDKHPEERRWYISDVTSLPANIEDYSAPKKVNEYFDANVVSPAERRGVVVQYDDQESQINGGSVLAMQSREQAEEMRKKDIEDRKEQGGNIYSFKIVFGAAKGEETSQPHLIYRNKEQPNYEPSKKP